MIAEETGAEKATERAETTLESTEATATDVGTAIEVESESGTAGAGVSMLATLTDEATSTDRTGASEANRGNDDGTAAASEATATTDGTAPASELTAAIDGTASTSELTATADGTAPTSELTATADGTAELSDPGVAEMRAPAGGRLLPCDASGTGVSGAPDELIVELTTYP